MREYRYKAMAANGQIVAGLRSVESVDVLSQQLFSKNMVLLESRLTLGSFGKAFSMAARAGRRDLRDFTLHIATSLSAGIPIIAALRDFEAESAKGPFKDIVTDIREEIASGSQVSEALSKHREVFSGIYLAMVSAGEDSGDMSKAFADLVEYIEWIDDLQGKTKQALAYPLMLISGVIGLFLLMFTFVLPRFMGIFEKGAVELPKLTLIVIATFHWFNTWWPLIVVGLGASITCFVLAKRTDRGQYWIDASLLRLPVVGSFMHKIALSRFSKHFSLLFAAGTPLPRLLYLLGDVVGNAKMRQDVLDIRSRVVTGETLAASFKRASSFPPLIQRLVAVGEQSGQLDHTLLKAADYLDKEIPRALKQTFTVLEAVILCLLGGMIAVAALSVLLPILNMHSAAI